MASLPDVINPRSDVRASVTWGSRVGDGKRR